MKLKQLLSLNLAAALALGLCACQVPDAPASSEDAGGGEAVIVPAEEAQEELYLVRWNNTPYNFEAPALPEDRTQPGIAAGSIGALADKSGDFIKLAFAGGYEVWIHSWYLDAMDAAAQQTREAERLQALTSRESFQTVESFLDAEDYTFVCMAGAGLNCRAQPDAEGLALATLAFGDTVEVLGRDGGYYLCRLFDGSLVYCSTEYMSSEMTYVDLPGAVDLRVYLPTLEFEMLFASPNNITGEAMYPAIPLLEETTARMLAEAQDIFRSNGYTIKIYDAYRPKSAQYKLYDIVQDSRYIANPYNGNSWHQLGRAVDMSLINMETGEELEMPTPMHTFHETASRFNSYLWTEEAKKNVDYMTGVMTSVGFGTITTEWWHFEYTGIGDYMDPYLDFNTLTYRPISDLLP